MKAFSVNKNSWHYKLNIKMVKTNERLYRNDNAEKYVQSKDNLCSYWRMTLWSVFKLAVAAAFVLGLAAVALYLVGGYIYALLFHTSTALIGTALLAVVLGLFVGTIFIITLISKHHRNKLDKILFEDATETSLAKAQYSSWKKGICVPVEFKG